MNIGVYSLLVRVLVKEIRELSKLSLCTKLLGDIPLLQLYLCSNTQTICGNGLYEFKKRVLELISLESDVNTSVTQYTHA